jgi:Bifunctional DNA primase/polymerase, N-terminal
VTAAGFDFHPPVSAAAVEWALAYARAAMAVLPVGADKKPLTEHGVKDATTDPDQIRAWWKRWPHAEIGWAVPETLVVVDLDRRAGADGLRDFFEHEGIEVDAFETPIAVTPSGGRHLVFDAKGAPYRNGVRVNGSAVDLRTIGGYVVLPRSGNGRWWLKPLSMSLAPMPSWLPVKPPGGPAGEARTFTGEASRDALQALQRACHAIETAVNGAQETTLNNHSFHIGRRIGAGQLEARAAIEALSAAAARMPTHRGPWRDLAAKVTHAVEDGMNEPWRIEEPGEDRLFSMNTVLGLARAVATAAPEKRVALTTWASRRMAGNVRAGNIDADLAHRVLFEAAMRNGLPAIEAGSIIENAFRSSARE